MKNRLRFRLTGMSALALVLCTPALAEAQTAQNNAKPTAAAAPVQAAPLSELVKAIDIPYQSFTLKNGLRVLVHTDRKAPVVGVTVYYRVGSKNEPKGKTGFAHLFEHLMFGGSENVPNYDTPLTEAGSTPTNGSTWFDRTNYVETVPVGALDIALFEEADRMGHLLGAVSQSKLDAQRGVVQNEKRQGDNQPFGLVQYAQTAALFAADHPYGHSTIGSMADLDAASLADVKQWFRDNYAPNNAVLALAGDIDLATAKAKVEKYFGDIPAGRVVPPVTAPVPTLAKRVDQVLKDRVATTRVFRVWTGPGLNDPDATQLAIGAAVLGGLASSRLDNILVRQEQLAVGVSANYQVFEQIGQFEVTADVKPGVDPAKVAARLEQVIADLVSKGPSADEVNRVATRAASSQIAGLEVVGGFDGKASTLAEGLLYSNDPTYYKKQLTQLATATPDSVRTALKKWLSRPVYALTVEPGERSSYDESKLSGPAIAAKDAAAPAVEEAAVQPTLTIPKAEPSPAVDFPDVTTSTLSNGVKVHFARRNAVPTVQVSLSFDTGVAAEPREKSGIGKLMLALMEAGTTTRDATQLAEDEERLGADVSTSETTDRTLIGLSALTPNLAPSLDLLADVVRNPAFKPGEVERLRTIQLTNIAAELTQPTSLATRQIYNVLYGPVHPYGAPSGGTGTVASVKAISRDDLVAFHRQWLRPDKLEIFVAGNVDPQQLLPMLDARFGQWAATRDVPPQKNFAAPIPAAQSRIFFINQPQSPQSVILAAQVTRKTARDDLSAFDIANSILGGDFTSRLNLDIREEKAWSYGVRSLIGRREQPSPFVIIAPVQSDKTGPAIAAIRQDVSAFLSTKGVTQDEYTRLLGAAIARLPGEFETTGAILGQMESDALAKRPFNYVESLPARYAALTPAALDAAARDVLDPARFSWVVVGDATSVLPQLKALDIPVTVVDTAATPTK